MPLKETGERSPSQELPLRPRAADEPRTSLAGAVLTFGAGAVLGFVGLFVLAGPMTQCRGATRSQRVRIEEREAAIDRALAEERTRENG